MSNVIRLHKTQQNQQSRLLFKEVQAELVRGRRTAFIKFLSVVALCILLAIVALLAPVFLDSLLTSHLS